MEMRNCGKVSSDSTSRSGKTHLWWTCGATAQGPVANLPGAALPAADPSSLPLRGCTHALNTRRGYLTPLLCRLALFHGEHLRARQGRGCRVCNFTHPVLLGQTFPRLVLSGAITLNRLLELLGHHIDFHLECPLESEP